MATSPRPNRSALAKSDQMFYSAKSGDIPLAAAREEGLMVIACLRIPHFSLRVAMLARAFAAAVPARWVVADEIYGNDGALRRWLHEQERGYVLGVARSHMIWLEETWTQQRVAETIRAAGRCLAAAVGWLWEQGTAPVRWGRTTAPIRLATRLGAKRAGAPVA